MKDRIQLLAVTVMTLMVMDTRANVQFQPLNNTFLPGYGFITAGKEKQTAPPFILEDPFLLLQKNYPLVYNHLLHEFKNAASLIYSVEGNAILISFSSNSNRVFAVYSIDGSSGIQLKISDWHYPVS